MSETIRIVTGFPFTLSRDHDRDYGGAVVDVTFTYPTNEEILPSDEVYIRGFFKRRGASDVLLTLRRQD